MKNIEEIRASILEAMIAGTDEPEDLSKSADQVLADAITTYLASPTSNSQPTQTKDGKAIKIKGIAMTCAAQGYSANLRPVSLLMKSKIEDLTNEQWLALKYLGYQINRLA